MSPFQYDISTKTNYYDDIIYTTCHSCHFLVNCAQMVSKKSQSNSINPRISYRRYLLFYLVHACTNENTRNCREKS